MKYFDTLLAFMFVICVIACKKPESMAATPAPYPSENITFIPTWQNDTLLNGYRVNSTDTLYTIMRSDTSILVSCGVELYVFGYSIDTTVGSWFKCFIGPNPLDSTTAYSKCIVKPPYYFSVSDNRRIYQQQTVAITTRYPHFATTGDAWYLGRKN